MGDLASSVYLKFPALRNVAATAKGLSIRRARYGRYYRDAIAGILARDRWSPERIEEYQSARLREIVRIAAAHVPHYRDLFPRLGISADDIRNAADLPNLPILEKEAVRTAAMRFVDERLLTGELLEESTSGSTGTPVRVLKTARAEQENYAYFEARCRLVAGVRYGKDPYVMFGAKRVAPLESVRPPFWCYNYAGRQLYMSVFHLAPRFLGYYCEELRRRPYKALLGYPSVMAAIAGYMLQRGIGDIRIPAAITNGETLHPHQKALIEKAFGCRVYNQYGCVELSAFAAGRRCGHMHVSPDYGVVEIVDDYGRPVPPGVPGHLVCTGLINDAQILLRYRVGDMASWSAEPCPEAPAMPVLAAVEGRTANAIILPDGRRVFRIGAFAEDIPSIRECQIVQTGIGSFVIKVVAAEGFGEEHKRELMRNLAANVGPADIEIELADRIERGPGGKFAFIVSQVTADQAEMATQIR